MIQCQSNACALWKITLNNKYSTIDKIDMWYVNAILFLAACMCIAVYWKKQNKTNKNPTHLDFHERPSEMIQIRWSEVEKTLWKKKVAKHFVLLPRQQGMTIFIYLQGGASYIGWALFLLLRGIYHQYDCLRAMLSVLHFVTMHILYWMWYFMILLSRLGEEVC